MPRGLSRPSLVASAVALAVLLPAAPALARGSSAVPSVTISPLPGTPDAPPRTQISFLGLPRRDLHDIRVVGSKSGRHSGRLEAYSTGTGASFLPRRPFRVGEQVHVSALLDRDGARRTVRTHFAVRRPLTLRPTPVHPKPEGQPGDVLAFHSRHDLHAPALFETTPPADPQLGDIFLSPDNGPGQSGAMIASPEGSLLWFHPVPLGTVDFDLQEQRYRGRPVLTYWQGTLVEGHGRGVGIIENDHYRTIARVHAGNGLAADLHEFRITRSGTAYISAYEPIEWNLGPEGGPSPGRVDDCVVQEIDIKTGLVMYEWHALGHVPIGETRMTIPEHSSTVLDWFHLNSVQPLANGDLLVSSRNTWGVFEISPHTGRVVWSLGGRHSTFKLGANVRFAFQHDAEMRPGGRITIFDDESTPPVGPQSRAITVQLNTATHTAALASAFKIPGTSLLTESQGNVQRLPGGDDMVGWGQVGYISEFSPTGSVTLDLHLPHEDSTYRAYRFPWRATPSAPPAVAASPDPEGGLAIYASWNGATGVSAWQALAGPSSNSLKPVGEPVASGGFETSLKLAEDPPYVAVQALGASGQVLVTSRPVRPRG